MTYIYKRLLNIATQIQIYITYLYITHFYKHIYVYYIIIFLHTKLKIKFVTNIYFKYLNLLEI